MHKTCSASFPSSCTHSHGEWHFPGTHMLKPETWESSQTSRSPSAPTSHQPPSPVNYGSIWYSLSGLTLNECSPFSSLPELLLQGSFTWSLCLLAYSPNISLVYGWYMIYDIIYMIFDIDYYTITIWYNPSSLACPNHIPQWSVPASVAPLPYSLHQPPHIPAIL